MVKNKTIGLAKSAILSTIGLILFCLLNWQLPHAQADTVSEGEKKLTCGQYSESFKNIEYYNGGVVCGGDINTGCQCVNNGDLIYKLDQSGNEWIKGNEDVGGSRFRGLGGDKFWLMNGASETNNRVLGWNSSAYKENDVYLQDNLIMYGRHIENQSDLGLFINMFSDKPVQIGGEGDGRLITSGSLVIDPRENWLIAPNNKQQYKYQRIQHSQADINKPLGNVAGDNDIKFLTGDAYLTGQVHLGGDGYNSTYTSGLMFYPWQYYMTDPRSAYQGAQYQEKWRKRLMALDSNNDGNTDGYDANINGFAAMIEASDYFTNNCSGGGSLPDCLDNFPSYDKETRGSLPNSNQLKPVGDDHVDLRMYLASGLEDLNRFSVWSWPMDNNNENFYDSIFSADSPSQLQHAFYGNGLAYHRAGVVFNPLPEPPDNPKEGAVYYTSASHELKYYNGAVWKSIGEGGSAGDFTNCSYVKIDPANQDGKRNIDCSNLPLNSGYVMQGICLSESGQKQCYNSDLGMVWGFVKCCSQ
ncbi:MAG: hypothetical protein V1684_03170 [bacterium]